MNDEPRYPSGVQGDCKYHYSPPWQISPKYLCGYCHGCKYDVKYDSDESDEEITLAHPCYYCPKCPYDFKCIYPGRANNPEGTLKTNKVKG